LGRNAFAAKINMKFTFISIGLILFSVPIFVFSSASARPFHIDSFLSSLFLPVLFAIIINSKRGATDPLNSRHLKAVLAEWKTGKENRHPYELRRDRTESLITAGVYAFILILLSRIDFYGHTALMWNLALMGVAHVVYFGKYQGVCPYCDYSLQNVPVHRSAFQCPVCGQRIIQNGNRLDRPRGRKAG